ncbi:hypothetical protein ACHAWF_015624 [Thalassiosira exigua]
MGQDSKDPPQVTAVADDAAPQLPLPSAPPLDYSDEATPPAIANAVPAGDNVAGVVQVSAAVADATRTPSSPSNAEGAVVVPPPFLIPTGARFYNFSIPDSKVWQEPSPSKLSKKCHVLNPTDSETKQLRKLKVPIEAAEIVAYIYAKKGKVDIDLMESLVMENILGKVKRTYRSAILTKGSVQLKKLPFGNMKTLFSGDSGTPNINCSLYDLRGVYVCGSDDNVVVVAYREDLRSEGTESAAQEKMRFAIYQTPDVLRFMAPLANVLLAAYTARPVWSIPVSWAGNVPQLPAVSREVHDRWMGNDGGFSSAMHAAAIAFHVNWKKPLDKLSGGAGAISAAIMSQQPQERCFLVSNGPMQIDVGALAKEFSDNTKIVLSQAEQRVVNEMEWRHRELREKSPKLSEKVAVLYMPTALILGALRALSFNLVFRKVILSGLPAEVTKLPSFRDALGELLLYNVSLREVDLSSSPLQGLGETIGMAVSMNAQPLISRINFSNCKLSGEDLKGLLNGLARIWCGGTALAESICMANNPGIPSEVWDSFFEAFLDPSTAMHWVEKSPPPPNFAYLQELDIRGTNAVGPGIISFAHKLTGLRTLKLASNGDNRFIASEFLSSLAKAGAPLGHIVADNFDASCVSPLFTFCITLRVLIMNSFSGDAWVLLCGWPQPVPKLRLTVGAQHSVCPGSAWSKPSDLGFTPGELIVYNDSGFGTLAMRALGNCTYDNGLRKLDLHNIVYTQILAASDMLAGLESVHVTPLSYNLGSAINMQKQVGVQRIQSFWGNLSRSKTLRDLQLPDQLIGGTHSDQLAMVGVFLKKNRSVQRIDFDSPILLLKVEDVKALRSAFYGNKKVVFLEYPRKAREYTLQEVARETKVQWREVEMCKAKIKRLFKAAYSKYNPRWRDGPNVQKLPWVDRIRVAKRKIGQMQRDQKKIATLLSEIQACVEANKRERAIVEEQKANERIVRRSPQLCKLGEKKKKFATNLVTKLHKAKLRGRQQKSAKTQLPRSAYYKNKHIWPSAQPPRPPIMQPEPNKPHKPHRPHSWYNSYNDPYYARPHWWYYSHYPYYHSYNDYSYFDREDSSTSIASQMAEMGPGGDGESQTNAAWGGMLADVGDGVLPSCANDDPWSCVDTLVNEVGTNYESILSPEYLAVLHEECSELGPDVLQTIHGTLDDGATISDKLEEIGTSTSAPPEMVAGVVDSDQIDFEMLESTLDDVPEFDGGIDDFNDTSDALGADEAVGMYAGAGPRDLDDGGPSFGGSSNAALAGARRRAKARKTNKIMCRERGRANKQLRGYKRLDLISPYEQSRIETISDNVWPNNLVNDWVADVTIRQIEAIAEINSFDLPAASSGPHFLVHQWSADAQVRDDIEVVLVTQCSLDRLTNLKAQLSCWTGKASVALYLKASEDRAIAVLQIGAAIEDARMHAEASCHEQTQFEVAVTVVEGCIDDEPYPINYLRNVALLEAQRQHLRFNASLDTSAVLLGKSNHCPVLGSVHIFLTDFFTQLMLTFDLVQISSKQCTLGMRREPFWTSPKLLFTLHLSLLLHLVQRLWLSSTSW